MEYQNIIYNIDNGIAKIILNYPEKLNPFNGTTINEVLEAVKQAEADKQVKVVIIGANGKSFSGGGDINAMYEGAKNNEEYIGDTVGPIGQISYTIKAMSKPVIGVVFGAVAGAAFNIALACDFCFAAENSKFIQAFVNIGLIPDAGGLFLLSRAVGVNKAMQIALTGKIVTAEEGKNLGFVYQVCAAEELMPAAEKLATKIAKGPGLSYAYMKELMFKSQFTDMKDYLELEAQRQTDCSHTEDYVEGITAFLEKRKAEFKGK